MTTTCLITDVGGKQGNAACKILSLQQSLFFVSVKFHGDHNTAYNDEVKSGHPQFWDIIGSYIVVSVC